MNILKAVSAALALGALVPATAMAAIIAIDTSTGGGGDTYVSTHPGEINVPLGNATAMVLKNDFGTLGWDRKGYIQFDLSGLIYPATAVELDLGYLANPDGTATVNVYGLVDGNAGEGWNENGISWYSAPANNTTGAGFGSGSSFLGSFSVTGATEGDRLTFSSVAFLDFLNLDTNGLITIMLARADESSSALTFATNENLDYSGPMLHITTSAVPVPTAAWLFCSGMLGLIGVARRKNNS